MLKLVALLLFQLMFNVYTLISYIYTFLEISKISRKIFIVESVKCSKALQILRSTKTDLWK